jgi:hypothetical protein
MAWQPMKTAPKEHGAEVLAWFPKHKLDENDESTDEVVGGAIAQIERQGDGWTEPEWLGTHGSYFMEDWVFAEDPVLWRPLPPAPTEAELDVAFGVLITHCPWCKSPVSVADEPYCANADCRWNNGGAPPARDVACVPCCACCGTHEVSQQQTCHNSACEAYGRDVTIYEGWKASRGVALTSPVSDGTSNEGGANHGA